MDTAVRSDILSSDTHSQRTRRLDLSNTLAACSERSVNEGELSAWLLGSGLLSSQTHGVKHAEEAQLELSLKQQTSDGERAQIKILFIRRIFHNVLSSTLLLCLVNPVSYPMTV